MKRIVVSLSLLLTLLIGVITPSTAANAQFLTSPSDFRILSVTSILDTKNNEIYQFENSEDMQAFLGTQLPLKMNKSIKRSSRCLPGDPGYPRCQPNPVVSSYSVFKHSYNTYRSSDYLAITIKGPGNVIISQSVGVSIEGLSVSKSTGASFPVPAGKYGNIVITASIKNSVYQYMYRHKNGKVTPGGTYTKKSLNSSWYEVRIW